MTVSIDGSILEGGGQIVRIATALSAITGTEVLVDNIRAGRKNPGLSPQHLTGLHLVASTTRSVLQGGTPRSTSIRLSAGRCPPAAGTFEADTKTAGSCTLLVQQILPVLLFASDEGDTSIPARPSQEQQLQLQHAGSSSTVTLKGGTDASFAPPIGYLQHVFLPTLKRLVAPVVPTPHLKLVRRGFYPLGGGIVQLAIPSLPPNTPLPSWNLTQRGYLTKITGYAVTAGKLSQDFGQRMVTSAKQHLRVALNDPSVVLGTSYNAETPGLDRLSGLQEPQRPQPLLSPASSGAGACAATAADGSSGRTDVVLDIQAVHETADMALGSGGSIVLVAETSTGCLLGASALAERGVTAEAVGAMAARDLLEELRSGAVVDSWMQDQLIIFMALAKGSSSMLCAEPTLHTRTAMAVAQQMLPGVQFGVKAWLPGSDSHIRQNKRSTHVFLIQCTGAGQLKQSKP